MNQLIDIHGLFNCLRPEPIDDNGAFINEEPEVHECDFCINRATQSTEFIEDGKRKHRYTCDECYEIENMKDKEIKIENKLL